MRKRLIASILVSLFSLSPLAAAQTSAPLDAESRSAAYKDGQRAIAAKNWSAAETILQRLWSESPTYDVAANLGQAEYNLKRYRKAAEHFAFSIQNFPPKEKVEKLAQTKRFLLEASKHIGTLHITVERAGAELRIDDEAIGTSPLPASTYVDAGTHVIEARIAEHPTARQEITVLAGGVVNVELKFADPVLLPGTGAQPAVASGLEPEGKAAPAVNPPPSDSQKRGVEARTVALWSGAGVTAVALGVGIGFALKASAANDDADSARSKLQPGDCYSPPGPASCSSLKQSLDERNSANKVMNISFAVAGAAAVATTAAFFIWPSRRTQTARELRVLPVATQNTGGLVINGNF